MAQKADKDKQVITEDLWNEFHTLVKETNGNINNFEDDGSWPVDVDNFIEYLQSK
jgi:hypothetical protein